MGPIALGLLCCLLAVTAVAGGAAVALATFTYGSGKISVSSCRFHGPSFVFVRDYLVVTRRTR